jgi:hypothetical protein
MPVLFSSVGADIDVLTDSIGISRDAPDDIISRVKYSVNLCLIAIFRNKPGIDVIKLTAVGAS